MDIKDTQTLGLEQKWQPEDFRLAQTILDGQQYPISEKCQVLFKLRSLSSVETNPQIQQIISNNLLQSLTHVTQLQIEDKSRLDLIWIVTNLLSGDSQDTESVLKYMGIPYFVTHLGHANHDIVDQSLWAIGNIAGDSKEKRNLLVYQHAMIDHVIESYARFIEKGSSSMTQSKLTNYAWVLSNLVRGKPVISYKEGIQVVPIFRDIILMSNYNHEVMCDCFWGLSYLTDGYSDEQIIKVVENSQLIEMAPKVIQNTDFHQSNLITPLIRALGNIASGNDKCVDLLIAMDVLPALIDMLLISPKKAIKKEIAWLLSNVAAGTLNQVYYLLSQKNFTENIEIMMKQSELDIQQECMWVIANMMTCLPVDEKIKLIQQGFYDCMFSCYSVLQHEAQMYGVFSEFLDSLCPIFENLIHNSIANQVMFLKASSILKSLLDFEIGHHDQHIKQISKACFKYIQSNPCQQLLVANHDITDPIIAGKSQLEKSIDAASGSNKPKNKNNQPASLRTEYKKSGVANAQNQDEDEDFQDVDDQDADQDDEDEGDDKEQDDDDQEQENLQGEEQASENSNSNSNTEEVNNEAGAAAVPNKVVFISAAAAAAAAAPFPDPNQFQSNSAAPSQEITNTFYNF